MSVKKAINNAERALGMVLKNEQVEAIELFVSGKDVFVILSTGFGKSMCYACLPLVFVALQLKQGFDCHMF